MAQVLLAIDVDYFDGNDLVFRDAFLFFYFGWFLFDLYCEQVSLDHGDLLTFLSCEELLLQLLCFPLELCFGLGTWRFRCREIVIDDLGNHAQRNDSILLQLFILLLLLVDKDVITCLLFYLLRHDQ